MLLERTNRFALVNHIVLPLSYKEQKAIEEF